MYLALFLAPWVVMYAVTTMGMNRRHAQPLKFEPVRELTYDGALPEDARLAARQLLAALGLEGAHNVPPRRPDGTLVVQRQSIGAVYRVTYRPEDRHVLVEKGEVRGVNLMHSLHRRRGYQHPYLLDDLWAFSVDLFIAAAVLWALSGLWMWWELKATRGLGLLSLAAGAALFAFFLVTL
jgi:hypothetical protein